MKKKQQGRDYYKELDSIIRRWEELKYNPYSDGKVVDKIEWCWKFRHITREQFDNLVGRMCELYESRILVKYY